MVSTLDLAYAIGGGWTEKVMPGAFTDSIADHPTVPIFYNHNWSAPIGSGRPSEAAGQLLVDFRLYLGKGELPDLVYQAMLDGALEEWSIGFWPEQISVDVNNPKCDQVVIGDLAEASVCVRGANPETGTLELAGKRGWLMGTDQERRREVEVIRRALVGIR